MGLLEEQLDLRTEQHKSRQRIKAAPPAQRQIIEQQEAQRLGELAKTLNPGAYDNWMRQQLSDPMPQEPMQSSAQGAGVVQPKYRNPSIQNYNVSRAPGVVDVHLGKSSVAAAPVVNPGAPANSFPLTREHVQTMMNPGNPQGVARRSGLPPYEKPGLLAQAGDALGKFGSSLSKGAGNLFNDPNRMALLQGGLSMMDPNSYYDQQGFGSVFTGLNRGLGAAQSGMQGVLDRRKTIADRNLAEAQAGLARQGGKPPNDIALYEAAKLQGYKGKLVDFMKIKAEAGKPVTTINMENQGTADYNKQFLKDFTDNQKPKARDAEAALFNMAQSRRLLEKGILTGPGVTPAIWLSNLMDKLGMDAPYKDKADRTRTYISNMGGAVAKAINAFGAGTGLSDNDRIFAQGMVGQDPSEFSKDALRRLFILNEATNREQLRRYNENAQDILDHDTKGQMIGRKTLKKRIPPMSKALRDHIAENKRAGLLEADANGRIPMPDGWKGGQKDWDSIAAGIAGADGWSIKPKGS